MNSTTYHNDPSMGYYTGNGPISSAYQSQYPSTFTTNVHRNQFHPPAKQENINPKSKQSNHSHPNNNNNNNINISRPIYPNNNQQSTSNGKVYKFENGAVNSPDYYNRLRSQTRSNTPGAYPTSTNNAANSNSDLPIIHPPSSNRPVHPTTAAVNKQTDRTFLVVPGSMTARTSPPIQPPPSTFTPIPMPNYRAPSAQITSDLDPSPDYLHYSMDSLIQRLVPTDTYIPKQIFIYPMFLCSRMNIRPSLFFNQLARLTIKSITNMTRDRSIRTMNNFLYVLSQWTRTFPYDFRNSEMMSQLEDLFKKITLFESTLESDINHIYKKLRSKLKALDHYEEYIQQLNKKAMYNLTQLALSTDITNECPTAVLFAQQLTHIELDRLKPVGAEELIQYFIMKLASEEARAHPNKIPNPQTDPSNGGNLVHDKKLTFCLEAYIQWFNRLTFFITTEIVKHTHRRSRIKLINYFIDAAYECFRLKNFNSMIGILGGLNMQPVRRLKKTWDKIHLDKFQHLEQYMDVSKNFATYRLVLKVAMEEAKKHDWAVDKFVIPFMSIILQDVYYIKTHSKDYTTTGGINLKKYYSMAKFISEEFVQCKQSKCSFERSDVIINYIITSPTFNEDSLMLASYECEPPATLNEKDKYRSLQRAINKST